MRKARTGVGSGSVPSSTAGPLHVRAKPPHPLHLHTTALVQQPFPAFGLCNLASGSTIEVGNSRTFRMRHQIPFEDAVGEFDAARWTPHSAYHMN